jgi:hypothetical protein
MLELARCIGDFAALLLDRLCSLLHGRFGGFRGSGGRHGPITHRRRLSPGARCIKTRDERAGIPATADLAAEHGGQFEHTCLEKLRLPESRGPVAVRDNKIVAPPRAEMSRPRAPK